MKEEWLVWRIWLQGNDGLIDIETKWSVDDIVKANILLNYNSEVQEEIEAKERLRMSI